MLVTMCRLPCRLVHLPCPSLHTHLTQLTRVASPESAVTKLTREGCETVHMALIRP
jgi:hypothetical protein